MSKKLMIMALGAGLVSFAGMFGVAWFTQKPAPIQSTEAGEASQHAEAQIVQLQAQAAGGTSSTLTEKQLQTLVSEVREKIQEYNFKLQDVQLREQRLQMTQDTLKKDIEELNNLRVELAAAVAGLKSEQEALLKSRVEIEKSEKNNLSLIAAAYDKMDPTSAGKILTTIGQAKNGNADDAIKILYYMPDRTKAKVLASIADTEPAVSAFFCQRLKQITEEQ